MKLSLTMGLLFTSFFTFGQTQIRGTVFSGSFLKPLKNAHIRCSGKSVKTDYTGTYSLTCKNGESILLSANGYSLQEIHVDHIKPNQTNDFYLTPSSSSISQTIPPNETEIVYWKNFEHVSDYEFVSDTLLVLTYLPDENFRKDEHVNCIITSMKYGEVINRQVVPSHTSNLAQNPSGDIYLYGSEHRFEIVLNGKQINWSEMTTTQLVELLQHAKKDNYIYSLEPTPIIPRVSHYIYDTRTGEKYLVRIVQDEAYFLKAPDDFQMLTPLELTLAAEVSNSTNVEINLLAPYIRDLYKYQGFKRPYAPGFIVGDNLLIFDHQNKWLFYHNLDGTAIKQTGIYHDDLINEELISINQDPVTEFIYTLHEKSGIQHIRKLDVETGATGRPYQMNNPFPKKVKVYNGYVYYLFQSSIEDKKWHLVRERLPF